MTIMMPANRMNPTAQVLVACARPADRYCGAACSDTADPSSSGLPGPPVVPAAAGAPCALAPPPRPASRPCGAAGSDTADPSSSGLPGQPVVPAAADAPSGQPSQ